MVLHIEGNSECHSAFPDGDGMGTEAFAEGFLTVGCSDDQLQQLLEELGHGDTVEQGAGIEVHPVWRSLRKGSSWNRSDNPTSAGRPLDLTISSAIWIS